MKGVSEVLQAIESGQSADTEQLLPAVYNELKQMARVMMAREAPGHTLQATALVHETYLRLFQGDASVGTARAALNSDKGQPLDAPCENLGWNSRAHFFSAAAEAMRRILIDAARRKKRHKRGGEHMRVELEPATLIVDSPPDELLDLDQALTRLESQDKLKADVVKLRYFAGLTVAETAKALQVSEPTVKRYWAYARAWLRRETMGD
jgi:RNA polymerase sigma factor (sigma-70 family)